MATGAETYNAPRDLSIYNPNGPSVNWSRAFRSDRAKDGYGSPGLSPGWTHEYDISIQRALKITTYPTPPGSPPGTPVSPPTYSLENPMLISANGSSEVLGSASSPFFVTYGTVSGTGTSETYSSFTITWKGGTKWTFTPATPFYYVLTRITRNTGQSIDLSWDTAQRLTSITDTTSSTTLLTLSYDGSGLLSTAVDVYGRKIAYNFGTATGSGLAIQCLLEVSLLSLASVSSPPTLYSYTYIGYSGQPLLTTMSMPSPTGTGTSTATINYNLSVVC
jgi:YD repeat-containing protein